MCRSSPRPNLSPVPFRTTGEAGVEHNDYRLLTADPSQVCDGRTLDPKAKYTLDRLPKVSLSLFQNYYSKVRWIRTHRRPSKRSKGRGRIDSCYDDVTNSATTNSATTNSATTNSATNSATLSRSSGDASDSTGCSPPGASRRPSSPTSVASCDRTASFCPDTYLADGAKPRAILRRKHRKHRPCHHNASMNRKVKGIMKPTDRSPVEAYDDGAAPPCRRAFVPRVSACSLGFTEFPADGDGWGEDWVPLGVDFDANVELYVRQVDLNVKTNMEVYIYDTA